MRDCLKLYFRPRVGLRGEQISLGRVWDVLYTIVERLMAENMLMSFSQAAIMIAIRG